MEDCSDWLCQDGYFKCSKSGICIKDHKVCDGRHDCGAADGSDEHDCPCDEPSNFRNLFQRLVINIGRECLNNPATGIEIRSITIDNVRSAGIQLNFILFSIFFCRKVVGINIARDGKTKENCTFHSLQQEYKKIRKFYVTTFLPLTKDGFVYQFRSDGKKNDQQNLDIDWFLRRKLIEYGSESPIILRHLNNLKRMVHWKKHHDIR